MEQPQPQAGLCNPAGFAVDAEASLILVSQCGSVRGRMSELCVDGCRVRPDHSFRLPTPASVEVLFKLNGMAFRLAGTMEWREAERAAAVRFSPMADRRRADLLDLLAELRAVQNPESSSASPAPAPTSRPQPAAALPAPPVLSDGPIPQAAPAPQEIPAPQANPAHTASPPGRDRRTQARETVDTTATIYFIDVRAQISGRILDLSMGGCRVRTDERFPVGIYRRVETEFKLDGLPFRLAGVIQSLHDKFTVGVRFLDLSSRKREQLEQLMREMAEMRGARSANSAVA